MRRRKGSKGSNDRRLAAAVLALAGLVGIAAAGGFSCVSGERPGPDLTIPRELPGAPGMRVALAKPLAAGKATVEVRGPYRIYASDAADAKAQFAGEALPPAVLALEAGGGAIAFGQSTFRPALVRIVPENNGTLLVDGTAYRGDLVARAGPGGKGLLCVNRVNLEEYTAGVVGSEMPLAFPEPSLRAQAIASRTYGLHQARIRPGELYDVTDDQGSQVYKGLTNETDRARQVTLDTLGVILTYRGRVLKTYFHSTCGGETVSSALVFGETEIPPLAGGPCGFCEDSKYYRWTAEVKRAELAAKLAKEGCPLARLARLEVSAPGPGGQVTTVRALDAAGGGWQIAATKIRAIVGTSAIRSTAFTIEDAGGDAIVFRGRGWGHGVGMCQIGARGMGRAGHDAVAILRRYYPTAELVKIYGSARAAGDGRP